MLNTLFFGCIGGRKRKIDRKKIKEKREINRLDK